MILNSIFMVLGILIFSGLMEHGPIYMNQYELAYMFSLHAIIGDVTCFVMEGLLENLCSLY